MSHLLKNNRFSLAHAACLGLGWGSLGPKLAMENVAERKKKIPERVCIGK